MSKLPWRGIQLPIGLYQTVQLGVTIAVLLVSQSVELTKVATASDDLKLDTSTSSEWPQWRGPRRDGIWSETGILTEFPAESLLPKWRVTIGPGFAGPAVSAGRVFVTDRQTGRNIERVHAFDEETGEQLWKFEYPAIYEGIDYSSGPRVTPTVDGDRVYVKGAMGHLFCLKTRDGREIWSHNLRTRFNARIPTWGMVGAPLVDGDSLIVNVGGLPGAGLIAFDKLSGNVKWQALDDRPGYAPPVIISAGGARQLIFWSAEGLNSLDPDTGASYWRIPFKDRADMTICAPVIHDDYLFVSSYYGGSLMLKLDDDRPAASVVWRDKRGVAAKLALCISTPLFKGHHLYGIDRSGSLRCLEISTGKLVWETTRATGGIEHGNAHITPNGQREFLFNEAGELIITELTPEGYHELSRTQLIAATAGVDDHRPVDWSHPAYAGRHIFVRNDDELRCVSLAADPD